MTEAKTTIERVRMIVADMGALGMPPPADDQPLFYSPGAGDVEAARANGNYGLDSLDRVEIIMTIEEDFFIDASDAELERAGDRLNTVAGIAAWVDEKRAA